MARPKNPNKPKLTKVAVPSSLMGEIKEHVSPSGKSAARAIEDWLRQGLEADKGPGAAYDQALLAGVGELLKWLSMAYSPWQETDEGKAAVRAGLAKLLDTVFAEVPTTPGQPQDIGPAPKDAGELYARVGAEAALTKIRQGKE